MANWVSWRRAGRIFFCAGLSGVIKHGVSERRRQQIPSFSGAPLKQRNGNVCSPPPSARLLKEPNRDTRSFEWISSASHFYWCVKKTCSSFLRGILETLFSGLTAGKKKTAKSSGELTGSRPLSNAVRASVGHPIERKMAV